MEMRIICISRCVYTCVAWLRRDTMASKQSFKNGGNVYCLQRTFSRHNSLHDTSISWSTG